jgi:hypothetical protein
MDDNIIGLTLAKKSPKKNGIHLIRAGTNSKAKDARLNVNSALESRNDQSQKSPESRYFGRARASEMSIKSNKIKKEM